MRFLSVILETSTKVLRMSKRASLPLGFKTNYGGKWHVTDNKGKKFDGRFVDIIEPVSKPSVDESNAVAKPEGLRRLMKDVSLGRDANGYYVYTHRCRSKSYPTPHDIPERRIKFVASTG